MSEETEKLQALERHLPHIAAGLLLLVEKQEEEIANLEENRDYWIDLRYEDKKQRDEQVVRIEDKYHQLYNEYLLAIGCHSAPDAYTGRYPQLPEWLQGNLKEKGESTSRYNLYPSLDRRREFLEKIDRLVQENFEHLAADPPVGKLWIEVAYELLQGLVEERAEGEGSES